MYLWIVLGTFMVALLSYTLPIRQDIDRQNNELKAQTVVTKFKVQHNAFKQYIESRKLKKTDDGGYEYPETVVYYSGVGYKAGEMLPSKVVHNNMSDNGFRGGINVARPFNPVKEKEDMEKYLPVGFKTDTNIYSKVFCFANVTEVANFEQLKFNYTKICEENDEHRYSDFEKDYCCSRTDVDVYVISWQEMPPRWKQQDPLFPDIPQPVSDMMSVIAKSDGYGYNFGYVTYLKSTAKPKNSDHIEKAEGDAKVFMDRDIHIMSGGMYRTLRAQLDEAGNPTGVYKEDLGYRPIFNVLLKDEDFSAHCAYSRGPGDSGIRNPCLIAINKVNNREGEGR